MAGQGDLGIGVFLANLADNGLRVLRGVDERGDTRSLCRRGRARACQNLLIGVELGAPFTAADIPSLERDHILIVRPYRLGRSCPPGPRRSLRHRCWQKEYCPLAIEARVAAATDVLWFPHLDSKSDNLKDLNFQRSLAHGDPCSIGRELLI
jgi:hypothetical protein